ncbi:tRNA (5-methylaminomethyl-2-thiouridine)(34)-methyltransferase MnmD [Asticcacaulis sp. EMRT-3]|uniref:tRNA (5-methylaminomethyl-2-thiouridine)(34)-methyltransferase MnmD n=1 Tax=Asticcacaulis sp. EMRT-3 TaxID=3040349 RepID=UPI0024AE99D4|nr:tRNA (5-methylaminomethyl-2-thiouridine)(34)-methyltransferase MnmD [Asticcacaulis sp. EMRT-3]MDI7774291.1 tRNA (5-methylaminomethyl-2-thiouridine)(34)-methyltransferase MnmD [Asticcacaulis sp. EMRT-3]
MSGDPGLYFAEDGAPRSQRFGDIYYSLQDGLNESRAVFLAGCGLPDAWLNRQDFRVLELGFGTGLNIVALLKLWADTRVPGAHLSIFSVEAYLMTAEEAGRALSAWPELAPYAEALLAQWPAARRGFARFDFPQWGASLTLALMDVRPALDQWQGRADAFFLDGFSPALNPDMWGEDVMLALAAHARPGARLGTFTVASAVRRGLQAAGFEVAKRPGFGRKRERLEAVLPGEAEAALPAKRIAIVGAGISGAALVWQARLMGLEIDLFSVGEGASANAAALVTPRFDAGHEADAALFADAFAYANAFYRRICPHAILAEGIDIAATSEREAERFARIRTQDVFADDDLILFAPGDSVAMPELPGLRLPGGLAIRPGAVIKSLLGDQSVIAEKVTGWRREVRLFSLITEAGTHEAYDAVILACGAGLLDFPAARKGLRPVRGQVELAPVSPPLQPASWGGYAVPVDGGCLFGATHDRDDLGTEVRMDDRQDNLDRLNRAMPQVAAAIDPSSLTSRASLRMSSRNHLPRSESLEPGLWRLSGLGGRGFCLAPLLAADLIADLAGLPSPLQRRAKKLLSSRDTV